MKVHPLLYFLQASENTLPAQISDYFAVGADIDGDVMYSSVPVGVRPLTSTELQGFLSPGLQTQSTPD